MAAAVEEKETVMNRRHVAVVVGTVCLLVLAMVMVVATTNLWAQAVPPKVAKPAITPITRMSPPPVLAMPDLVVTSITRRGAPAAAGSNVEVPVTVTVRNQGNAAAGAFKVSTDFSKAGAAPLAVAFSVAGQTDLWYPHATGLAAGSSITFRGKLLFLSSVHGAVTVKALADSCAGEEFADSWCHVKESNESNNQSTGLAVTLP
jgi:hypothetical protein